ncbi:MAG TPA: hypothetical protein VGJ26_21010 [Pirellulales bacterium]
MKGNLLEKYAKPSEAEKPDDQNGVSEDLGAFAFLRGVQDRALMLELRFKNGKRRALAYAWLHDAEFDPSDGITLHFGPKKVRIAGQNLNAEARPNVRLFDALARHRVPWIQEASGAGSWTADRGATTIDEIKVD